MQINCELIHKISINCQIRKCNLKVILCVLPVIGLPLNLPGRYVISTVSYLKVEFQVSLQISVYVYE